MPLLFMETVFNTIIVTDSLLALWLCANSKPLTSSPYKVNLEVGKVLAPQAPCGSASWVSWGLEKENVEGKNLPCAWRALICFSIGLPLEKMFHGGRRQLSGLKTV